MPDWKKLVRERLTSLRLPAAAEADLVEEVAQHLEDRFRELCSGGAGNEGAYRRTMAELDDLYPLRAGLEGKRSTSKYDTAPPGEVARGNLLEDFWQDLR